MKALDSALKFLGWQGGTVHQIRAELLAREENMIRMCSQMDQGERERERLRGRIALVQCLLAGLA